jgi:hypothetical protein
LLIFIREEDSKLREETLAAFDCSRFHNKNLHSRSYYQLLAKSKFVTGGHFSDDEDEADNEIDEEDEADSEDEKEDANNGSKKDEEGKAETEAGANEDDEKKKKLALRTNLKEQLLELDYGIYKRGLYVRVEVEGIKYKHFKNFRSDFPLILCRINPAEDTFGFLKVDYSY